MYAIQAIPSGCFLVLPYLVIKVNGKLQQLNSGSTTNGLDSWVTPPIHGKEP